MRRRIAAMGAAALLAGAAVPQARADVYAAEYTRGVAYWYLPTASEGVYRMYRVEVVQSTNLAAGDASTEASVVTDRCTEKRVGSGQIVLVCGDGRREHTTRNASLVLEPDLSGGKAEMRFRGRVHMVRFEAPEDPQNGAFSLLGSCSEAERQVVAGRLANMDRAHGRVLGKKLRGSYSPELDHAWIQRGYGTWCDEG